MVDCRCKWKDFRENCDWLKAINVKNFWKLCAEQIKEPQALFCHRNIYLGQAGNSSIILHMGLNPSKRFDFTVRIECQKTQTQFSLDAESFKTMLQYLEELSRIDIPHPSTIFSRKDINSKFSCITYYDQIYDLTDMTKSMKLDENTLDQLLKFKPFILSFIDRCEKRKNEWARCFILTICVYCRNYKTVSEMLSVKNQNDFLRELAQSPCNCAPRDHFLFDLAANLDEWMHKCLPIFIYECLMNNELMRYLSFNLSENQSQIDFSAYAMSGLFQVGKYNTTMQCAFCCEYVFGEENQSTKDILKNHYAISPHCQFLNDPTSTDNVPINKTNEELKIHFNNYLKDKSFLDEIMSRRWTF